MSRIAYERPKWLETFAGTDSCKGSYSLDDIPESSKPKMYLISKAMEILDEYDAQGYELTLRQLYYQFVSRDLIANDQKEYKRLGSAVNSGRMWGLIDWTHIVDRGRNYERRTSWDSPQDIIEAAARSYKLDRWKESPFHLEVWVEKQALEQVVEQAAEPFDVGYLACKGYMSQSEMWSAAQRLGAKRAAGKTAVIIHLGDHDPSGIDMSRDIGARLKQFGVTAEVRRIALNMDQIEEHNPPPNPAKQTDARYKNYERDFGDESWELDALEPSMIEDLITDTIKGYVFGSYVRAVATEKEHRNLIGRMAVNWEEINRLSMEGLL